MHGISRLSSTANFTNLIVRRSVTAKAAAADTAAQTSTTAAAAQAAPAPATPNTIGSSTTSVGRVQSGESNLLQTIGGLSTGASSVGDLFAAIQRIQSSGQNADRGNGPLIDPDSDGDGSAQSGATSATTSATATAATAATSAASSQNSAAQPSTPTAAPASTVGSSTTAVGRVQSAFDNLFQTISGLSTGKSSVGDLFAAIQRAQSSGQNADRGNGPLIDPNAGGADTGTLSATASPGPLADRHGRPLATPSLASIAPTYTASPATQATASAAASGTQTSTDLTSAVGRSVNAASLNAELLSGTFFDANA